MIAGTIVMEDLTLIFRMVYGENAPHQVTYTVAHSPSGQEETVTVDADAFMKALGMALQMDGEPPSDTDDFRAAVKLVQPHNPNLRFIP